MVLIFDTGLLLLSKPMGELEIFLAALFGPYEELLIFFLVVRDHGIQDK